MKAKEKELAMKVGGMTIYGYAFITGIGESIATTGDISMVTIGLLVLGSVLTLGARK